MHHVDELIETCVTTPDDHDARRVLSDALRAADEHDLAKAVESKTTGEKLIRATLALAVRTGLPPTLHLLWSAYTLVPALERTQPPPIRVVETPETGLVPLPVPPRRRGPWGPMHVPPTWGDYDETVWTTTTTNESSAVPAADQIRTDFLAHCQRLFSD